MPRARFKFVLYRDTRRQWRWRLVSSNGKIVADCGEGYRHRTDAVSIIAAIRGGATAGCPVVEESAAPAVVEKVAPRAAIAGPATKQAVRGPVAKRTSVSPTTKRASRR
jgi:uncharacterized protein YegP (UPF0339 family)